MTNKELAPISQRLTNTGSRKPGTTISRQQQWRRVLNPRSTSPGTNPGTSPGINRENNHNSNTPDLQGKPTVKCSHQGKATKETLEKEVEIGETQIKNMNIENHKRGTIQKSM